MSRDALIVGGGPAGAAAAIWLARAGWPVTLWEKERHPAHKICGEFLSWEAQTWLARLGLDLEALGAVSIEKLRLVTATRSAVSGLGFVARSVTRRALDAALLEIAMQAGADVQRGISAREVKPDGAVVASTTLVRPANLLLATGKHDLRGIGRPGEGTLNGQLGFKAYFRLTPAERSALSGHVELILFQGGYAGLQMVERDAANLCFLVSPERWKRLGGDFTALLADLSAEVPHLGQRLAGAVPLLDRPLAISGVPYGFLHRPVKGVAEPGWRLGDQAAVIPSFTGDGMSLALHSARLATEALLTGAGQGAYYRRLAKDAGGAVRRAAWLQRRSDDGLWRDRVAAVLALAPGLMRVGVGFTRLGRGAVGRALAV
ncbi:NAD(P)/FAD-dependent oxidoreductase [Sandaracinobacteroides hominis]|uniref:NAD(P)/FAD-dependent oxidoreductase n=1 Tax=Sandaracinobacteroides hominis TaxID=2780086 RepID=UPI0018F481B3|nr:FAD-dependent oxidoreductase [Sandaracinobacteroides hominis]